MEVDIGATYKPDVVAMERRRGRPRFWGEAGHVGPEKLEYLVSRHPGTHLAFAKWNQRLAPTRSTVEAAVDLLRFPADSNERFVDEKGRLSLSWNDVAWERVGSVAAER